jgi:hypothetical protein
VILKAMSNYMAGLDKFSVVANTTVDKIEEDGDKVQLSTRRMMHVTRPDKFAVNVDGDSGVRKFVYDGKTISMYDGSAKTYSVVQTPNTIDATLDTLAQDYGAVVPFEDIMYKDLYERMESLISQAQYLGLHTVDGVKCHHLAFVTDAAECEMWIDAGEKPVPRKFTIDYKQDANRSRYAASIVEWNASPAFTPETFEFKVPDDVKRVEIEPIGKEEKK